MRWRQINIVKYETLQQKTLKNYQKGSKNEPKMGPNEGSLFGTLSKNLMFWHLAISFEFLAQNERFYKPVLAGNGKRVKIWNAYENKRAFP